MKQTLFVIPHELNGIPVFGMGWLLALWLIGSAGYLCWLWRRQGWNKETASYLPTMLVGGIAILWLLPWLEASTGDGAVQGLAIRGYGMMFLLAVVTGVGITLLMARRAGIHPDVIFSMSFWCFVFGIIGARMFFVIQYWHEFYTPAQPPGLMTLVSRILKFTEGGLVVYGSLIGAMLAYLIVLHRRQLPKLATLDLFVPGLAIGLAFGRLGCLLNGCCWGGVCEEADAGIHFPAGAPAYMAQLHSGQLLGIELESNAGELVRSVSSVKPDSLAERKGVAVGDRITQLVSLSSHQLRDRSTSPTRSAVTLKRDQKPEIGWTLEQLPASSLGVVPTQILSSINAALICLLAWSWYPARRRDGELVAGMFTIYPVTRFLLEIIRSDEPGRWGTALTMSQWVSVLMLLVAVVLWARILSRPAQKALPAPQSK